jgi:hypothetical protein
MHNYAIVPEQQYGLVCLPVCVHVRLTACISKIRCQLSSFMRWGATSQKLKFSTISRTGLISSPRHCAPARSPPGSRVRDSARANCDHLQISVPADRKGESVHASAHMLHSKTLGLDILLMISTYRANIYGEADLEKFIFS